MGIIVAGFSSTAENLSLTGMKTIFKDILGLAKLNIDNHYFTLKQINTYHE
jgi:hypothetical protein